MRIHPLELEVKPPSSGLDVLNYAWAGKEQLQKQTKPGRSLFSPSKTQKSRFLSSPTFSRYVTTHVHRTSVNVSWLNGACKEVT